MEEFLRYAIGQLVEYPDELVLTRSELPGKTVFHAALRKSDVPKVIGKGGHTIQALRTLLHASALKKGLRVELEIIE